MNRLKTHFEGDSRLDKSGQEFQEYVLQLHCAGQIVLNMWHLLKWGRKLGIYTFKTCVSALLQLRPPHL